MGFDIYEEKVLSFSNVVMKQNRVLSYIFMGLYLLSVLKGMFTNLMKKLYPTQDKEYSAESFDKTGAIGMLVRSIIFIIISVFLSLRSFNNELYDCAFLHL